MTKFEKEGVVMSGEPGVSDVLPGPGWFWCGRQIRLDKKFQWVTCFVG